MALTPPEKTSFLLLVILLTPLPVLTLTGMEHVLHGLFKVWLLYSAVALLTDRDADFRQAVPVLALAGLVTMTRYEGLFLVFAISVLLLYQKRNVVCGDDTVTFFVPNPSLEQEALTNLREFAHDLPVTVKQSGKYVGQAEVSAQTK